MFKSRKKIDGHLAFTWLYETGELHSSHSHDNQRVLDVYCFAVIGYSIALLLWIVIGGDCAHPKGHFIGQMVLLGMDSGWSAEIKFFSLQRLLVP